MSEIANHPLGSMLPQDYIRNDDYIRELLKRWNKSDQIRIAYMLKQGIITPEDLKGIVDGMVIDVMLPALELKQNLLGKVGGLLDEQNKLPD